MQKFLTTIFVKQITMKSISLFRYHKNCYSGFVAVRSIKAALNKYDNKSMDRDALSYIIRSIRNDPEGVWDADYLHSCYLNKGGTDIHITRFRNRLKQFLNDEVYFFDSPGITTVIMAHDMAVKVLKVKASQNNDTGNDIKRFRKRSDLKLMLFHPWEKSILFLMMKTYKLLPQKHCKLCC